MSTRIRSLTMGAVLCTSLIGCAGVGIVTTSEPLEKLNDAKDLYARQARPLPAERLIQESIIIFEERSDSHGLGHAYREYADFLMSPTVLKFERFYRRDGFRDKSITFENREERASEFYRRAIQFYERAEQESRQAQRFDALANVYFNKAWAHYRVGEIENACAYYDKVLEAHNENIRRNPGTRQYGDLESAVSASKRRICQVESGVLVRRIYPAKPVRILVASPARRGVDMVVRILAPHLSELWGQPVTLENRPGTDGNEAVTIVAKSAADGYTILAHSALQLSATAGRTGTHQKDLAAVAPLPHQAYALVVGTQAGVASVAQLIASAKSRSAQFTFTSTGVGSSSYLLAERFNLSAGIVATHIPSSDDRAGIDAVMRGQVNYGFAPVRLILPDVLQGTLAPLTVTSLERQSALPQVPTIVELGITVPPPWYGLWAPSGTNDEVTNQIARDINRALDVPRVQEELAKLYDSPINMPVQQFRDFVRKSAEQKRQDAK